MELQSQRYSSWWSSAEEGKHKGSGVGLLIDKVWRSHLTEVLRPNAYSIKASFCFRKAKVVFWIVYLPPNSKLIQKEIQRLVTRDIANKKGNTHYIVGGDFNRILDQNLDTANPLPKGRKPHLPLIKWMTSLGFGEVFRICNPSTRKYTWANSLFQTRIDQIWVSSRIKEGLLESDIDEMSLVTNSDHNLVWAKINTAPFLGLNTKNTRKSKTADIPRRKIFLYKNASEENWEGYKNTLDKLLSRSAQNEQEIDSVSTVSNTIIEKFINEEWDRIVSSINRAAVKHIPSKNSSRSQEEKDKLVPRNSRYIDVKSLKRIVKRIKNSTLRPLDNIDIFLWNCQIQDINMRQEVQIEEINLSQEDIWIHNTKEWIKLIEKKIQREEQEKNEKRIIENIEKRYGMIGNMERKMLNSILERPWKNILIEKVLVDTGSSTENKELINNPEGVKEAVDTHFQNQFRRRDQKFNLINEE
jgi:exonuclease III